MSDNVSTPKTDFEIKNLNPLRPSDQYKVWRKVSVIRKKQIEWEVNKIATQQLIEIGGDTSPSNVSLFLYLYTDLESDVNTPCMPVIIAILEQLVEPQGKALPVKTIFVDLDWGFVKEACKDFTGSPLLNRAKFNENSKNTEEPTGDQSQMQSTSQEMSPKNTDAS